MGAFDTGRGLGRRLERTEVSDQQAAASLALKHARVDHARDEGGDGLTRGSQQTGDVLGPEIEMDADGAVRETPARALGDIEQEAHQALLHVAEGEVFDDLDRAAQHVAQDPDHRRGHLGVLEQGPADQRGLDAQESTLARGLDEGPGMGAVDVARREKGQRKLLVANAEKDARLPLDQDEDPILP